MDTSKLAQRDGNATAEASLNIVVAAAKPSTTSTKKTSTTVKQASSQKQTLSTKKTTVSTKQASDTQASTKTASSSKKTSATTTVATAQEAVATVKTGSGKRGLSFNLANMTQPFGKNHNPDSQVSWTYNWYLSACSGDPACKYNKALDYIPLLFSDETSVTSLWHDAATSAIASGSSALFSFNEPDVCWPGSACMPVASSVAAYKKHMQPFAGKAKLGAPAVTNGGAPYGLTYLQTFLDDCKGCTVDFINVHWYSNKYAGATYFESYMQQVRKVANGRPIWVTEFGLTDDDPYTQDELIAFLKTVMAWMDQQDDIHRYAYFMDEAGVLMGPAGKKISKAGQVYNTFHTTAKQATLS